MSGKVKLKPCPFCDCPKIDIRTRKTTIVERMNCNALFIRMDKKIAIKAWNRRAKKKEMQDV